MASVTGSAINIVAATRSSRRSKLALTETPISGESNLTDLGADSLDTVEIVMGLEEAFDISVEEDNAQNITTVQEAADLIQELVEAKSSSSS